VTAAQHAPPCPVDEFPWLSSVPSGWVVIRLKQTVADIKNGVWGDEPNGLDDLACVRVADFDRTTNRVDQAEPTLRAISRSQRKGRLLHRGDLLLEKSGGGEQQPVGCVVLFDLNMPEAVCSNFVAKITLANGFEPRFLAYEHAFLYAVEVNRRSIKQTTGIQNLDSDSYLNERIAVPPLEAQTAIADFLDRKTQAIDELIRKKERLIELLQEKRQALITQAVTKGLDPNVQMKDSGVPWLGKIPAHWSIVRTSYVASVFNGSTPARNVPDYWVDEGIPWLSSGKVNEDPILEPSAWISRTALRDCSLRLAPKGSVAVGMVGQGRTRGMTTRLGIDATINQNMAAIVPSASLDAEFLSYVFQAAYQDLRLLGRGANQAALNCEILKAYRIPLPALAEQRRIAELVVSALDRTARVQHPLLAQIARLQEYRQALISAAVTGQIDVSEEVAA